MLFFVEKYDVLTWWFQVLFSHLLSSINRLAASEMRKATSHFVLRQSMKFSSEKLARENLGFRTHAEGWRHTVDIWVPRQTSCQKPSTLESKLIVSFLVSMGGLPQEHFFLKKKLEISLLSLPPRFISIILVLSNQILQARSRLGIPIPNPPMQR